MPDEDGYALICQVRAVGEVGEVGKMSRELVKSHQDLEIYKMAFETAMNIFELSKKFPVEERYSLTDQIRRSSLSVCANMAEAWRKRRYEAAFIAKLNDCEAESVETQTWIEFAIKCNYRLRMCVRSSRFRTRAINSGPRTGLLT
jgi:four helix bundle protein